MERALAAGVSGFVVEGGRDDAIAQLTAEVRRRADESPLIAMAPHALSDLERGDAALPLPPFAALASFRDPLVIRHAARATARELRRIGCNAMLAPPADVAGAPRHDAFGDDPSVVASAVAEWIDAAQSEGTVCFAGDFPGGGRVAIDARGRRAVLESDDRLYAADLVPFRAAIDAGVAAITLAPAAYPALDASAIAAPLSRTMIGTMLRGQLAFDGLVVADSAALDASAGRFVSAVDLVTSGVDLVLRPTRVDVELRALMDAMRDGRVDPERVNDAARRRRARAELAAAPWTTNDSHDDDRAWLLEVAERAVTVVRGRTVRLTAPVDVAVVGGSTGERAAMVREFAAGVGEAGGDRDGVRQVTMPTAGNRSTVVALACSPEAGLVSAAAARAHAAERLAAVCEEARRMGRDLVLVWCGHPGDAPVLPTADLIVSCWTASAAMLRAAGRWSIRRGALRTS
jgi:beta-glucosidase-like glycosyl hydrolase